MILRAKTYDLFDSGNLTAKQIKNTQTNKSEIEKSTCELTSYPQRIVLELTNACNLNCIMCGRNYANFSPTIFDINQLYKMDDMLHYVEEVTLIGWGEPTMHPQFIDILKYLDKFNVRKFVCTNGMTLDKIKNAIFDYKLDLLTVSLDGSTSEINELIRQGSDFNKIINGAKDVVSERKKRNVNYPYLSTTTTIMKKNLNDFPNIVRMMGQIGFDEAKAVYLTAFSDDLANETLYDQKQLISEVFDKAIEIANQYNMKIKLPHLPGDDIAADKYHKDCFVAWRDLFLSSDGYVRPCMSTPIKLLNLSDYSCFFDLWNCHEFVNFRKNVNTDMMPGTCKNCYQASYANWNKKSSFLQLNGDFAPEWKK